MDEGHGIIPLNTQSFIIIGGGLGGGHWGEYKEGGGDRLWPFGVSLLFLLTKGQ